MEPQIQLRSDCPNVTYTTDGKVMMLQPLRHEQGIAVGVVRFHSPSQTRLVVETDLPQVVAITIRDIEVDGRILLRRKDPLELVAQRCEPGGCYYTDFPDLGVPIAGYSPEDLKSEAHALIVSTWRRCMVADEMTLAPLATRIKEQLQAQYAEVE